MATSPVQPESRRILLSLLSKLSLPDSPYARFSILITHSERLEQLMYRCIRADVLTLIDSGRIGSTNTIRSRNSSYTGRAIYLHAVKDLLFERLYIGQAQSLQNRLKQHMDFRYRRDHPSLHYHALQRSKEDYYAILAHVPDECSCKTLGIQDSLLFMDLLETWCCLMFRTLSVKYLKEFLPEDIEIPKKLYENLNLQLPLQSEMKWPEIRDILYQSPDSLQQDYYFNGALKCHHKTPELIENHKLCQEICKKLDGISTPRSVTLPPNLPSPPSSTAAEKRFKRQAFNEYQLNTPSKIRYKAAENTPKNGSGPSTGSTFAEVSYGVKNEQEKRKREPLEETPSTQPGHRPTKIIRISSAALTGLPVSRKLTYHTNAEPQKGITQIPANIIDDLVDQSSYDSDWFSDVEI